MGKATASCQESVTRRDLKQNHVFIRPHPGWRLRARLCDKRTDNGQTQFGSLFLQRAFSPAALDLEDLDSSSKRKYKI
eukprot:scaffold2462_cov127-Cylindrotheca_fusiformis.AAC.1